MGGYSVLEYHASDLVAQVLEIRGQVQRMDCICIRYARK